MLFQNRLTLFRLFGIEIRLDASWLLLAILITWTLAVGFFPQSYPDLEPGTYWLMGAIAALGLFASIILHELGHSVVAQRDGLEIDGITLFVFGGVAEMKAEPASPAKEFRMAIAGPIVSLALAFVCWLIAAGGNAVGAAAPFVGVFAYLALINTILAVFNMVPAFPLDGGRVLRAALWHWQGSLRRATRVTTTLGSGFGILLIVLGLLNVLAGNFIGGIWWFILGLFVRGAAQMSYQQVLVRRGLEGMPVSRVMNNAPVAVGPDLAIADLVDDYVYRHHFKFYPVVEDERLVGCVSLDDIKTVPRDEWATTEVGAIMRDCASDNTVTPETEAIDLLPRMRPQDSGRFLVTRNGKLEGIITRKDLLAFIAVKLDLEGDDAGQREPGRLGRDLG